MRSHNLARRGGLVAPLIVALLLLTGCGQGWIPGASSGSGIQLRYALWDPHEQIGYQQSIDQFEQLHPDIHVTIENIPYANFQQKITASFVAGDAPDVFWTNTPFLADFVKGGMLDNLASLIKRDHIDLSQYYPSLVKLHEHDGAIYGLPKDWDTIALYYNENYFAQHQIQVPAELTWNTDGTGTFTQLLKRLTIDKKGVAADQPGFDPNHVKTYGVAINNDPQSGWGNFSAMNGGSFLPAPYADHFSLDSPQTREAIQYVLDLMYREHVAVPGTEMGPAASGATAFQLFSSGQTAMVMNGDWNTVTLSQLVNFKLGVLPLPAGPDGRVSVFNGLVDSINTESPHQAAAWELEKWLGSARSEAILGRGGYVWPGIKGLDPLFVQYWKAKGIDMQPFLEEANGKTVNFPVSPGMGNALVDVVNNLGPAFVRSGSIEGSLASAEDLGNHDLQTNAGLT